jgi:hypothetical protein
MGDRITRVACCFVFGWAGARPALRQPVCCKAGSMRGRGRVGLMEACCKVPPDQLVQPALDSGSGVHQLQPHLYAFLKPAAY